jgi:hypothetical protein
VGGGATWPFNDQEKNRINIPPKNPTYFLFFCSPHTFASIYKLATLEGEAMLVKRKRFQNGVW